MTVERDDETEHFARDSDRAADYRRKPSARIWRMYSRMYSRLHSRHSGPLDGCSYVLSRVIRCNPFLQSERVVFADFGLMTRRE